MDIYNNTLDDARQYVSDAWGDYIWESLDAESRDSGYCDDLCDEIAETVYREVSTGAELTSPAVVARVKALVDARLG